MGHPEEIYKDINGKELSEPERIWGEGINLRRSYDLGHEAGYAKCLADRSYPLAGYSNLTAAISAGDPIDWEKLDGLKVKCVNPDMGELHGALKRDPACIPDVCGAWWDMSMDDAYTNALVDAWYGKSGWTLYVEGEIPMRRKTADQLEVGHFFTGKVPGANGENLMCVFVGLGNGKHVRYASDFMLSQYPASEWEVLEEYGTFQKPEDK